MSRFLSKVFTYRGYTFSSLDILNTKSSVLTMNVRSTSWSQPLAFFLYLNKTGEYLAFLYSVSNFPASDNKVTNPQKRNRTGDGVK